MIYQNLNEIVFTKNDLTNYIETYSSRSNYEEGVIKQNIPEIVEFIMWCFQQRDSINSYAEIGVYAGWTCYLMNNMLKKMNPNFKKTYAVDIGTKLTFRGLTEYQKDNNLIYLNSRSVDVPNLNVDLCFIDSDHSYEGVTADYNHFKNSSKFLAFHDINRKDFGVGRLFDEIKVHYSNHLTIVDSEHSPGIGIVWN